MNIELKIPDVGESVREIQIGRWLKEEGATVKQDEDLVELETDKASLELPAPESGVLTKILKRTGESAVVGETIGYLGEESEQSKASTEEKPQEETQVADEQSSPATDTDQQDGASAVHEDHADEPHPGSTALQPELTTNDIPVTPAGRRALREYNLSASQVPAKGLRLDRDTVLQYVRERTADEPAEAAAQRSLPSAEELPARETGAEEVPLSLLRRRIAERLVQAQHEGALLTTFNEIDMSNVQALRKEYRQRFQDRYGIKLGIMSFFVKATVEALKSEPKLNAEIRDDKIVFHNYYHLGIAIGSERGLVVPVLRNAERLSFSEIEQAIDSFARRAADRQIKPEELTGGTFTISNGGVFGSLLSTPVVNPPQSGVLGLHSIQDRPVARDGRIVIRPMMYIALTYDHRLVDGREAVTFLRRIKETVEQPARMLLEI